MTNIFIYCTTKFESITINIYSQFGTSQAKFVYCIITYKCNKLGYLSYAHNHRFVVFVWQFFLRDPFNHFPENLLKFELRRLRFCWACAPRESDLLCNNFGSKSLNSSRFPMSCPTATTKASLLHLFNENHLRKQLTKLCYQFLDFN